MSAPEITAATSVVRAAIEQGRDATGIVQALESAGLLMSPETANEPEAASALAWAENLDAKSLDNLLCDLGRACDHEPLDEALGEIERTLATWRTAVEGGDGS